LAYRSIDADNVVATIERLRRRIEERFPARGLAAVCAELRDVALKDIQRVRRLQRPYRFIRIGVGAIVLLLAASLFYLFREVKLPDLLNLFAPEPGQGAMLNLVQGLDSAVNVLILFGVFLFFLLRHEEREKRRLALADLYELRSIAHVIDMHQLTKDPVAMLSGHARTASSPKDQMTAF
jgi:hypothetical protein